MLERYNKIMIEGIDELDEKGQNEIKAAAVKMLLTTPQLSALERYKNNQDIEVSFDGVDLADESNILIDYICLVNKVDNRYKDLYEYLINKDEVIIESFRKQQGYHTDEKVVEIRQNRPWLLA